MHKWNALKRTAPFVLSLAVAVSGMPAAALGEEFTDEAAVEETVGVSGEGETEEDVTAPEEYDPANEIVFEDGFGGGEEEDSGFYTADEGFDEAEVFIGTDEADVAEEAAAPVSEGSVEAAGKSYTWKKIAETEDKAGFVQIGETDVYYAADEAVLEELASAIYYGKATLNYTEFYAGDTSKAAYDAITSATKSKFNLFPNEDISEVTDSGYQIYGVKNVNVAVNAKDYVEAQILKAAGCVPEAGIFAEAAGITLNEDAAAETDQYKTLNSDGTYSATKLNVAAIVTDAEATLLTSSRWGDYVIEVKETSTSNLRTSRSDDFNVNSQIQGIILETEDGASVGLRYTDEIWVQTYEAAFSKDLGLAGKTISRIKYIMPDSTYVYEFAKGIYVKQQPAEGMEISAEFTDKRTVKLGGLEALENAKASVYYVTGSGRQSVTTYMIQEAEPVNGTVTFDEGKMAEAGKEYTVKVTSDNYADMTAKAIREESGEFKYVYAGITWAEYWASESVLNGGSTEGSTEADGKGELDKGAFDTVTRATWTHGFHRGSYQCTAIIYATDGTQYAVQSWSGKNSAVLTDGSTITVSGKNITDANGAAHTMDHYEVKGIKYVPVKVNADDYDDFKAQYAVVENDGILSGGFSEVQLQSYTATAAVTENTNGLKTAVQGESGSFTFSKRANGADSGLKDVSQKTAADITVTVKEASGSYGEFLRVDLTGSGYGDLGANMQAVRWDYYGTDSTYTNCLQSFGTKFAADNWMHKSNGIQLGLTDSLRCKLPEGTDGTGFWKITVYALGYQDYTFNIEAASGNVVTGDKVSGSAEELKAAIDKAEALNQSEYTEESWSNVAAELEEAKAEYAAQHSLAAIKEATEHLNQAIAELVKVPEPTVAPQPTTVPEPTVAPQPTAVPEPTVAPQPEPTAAPAPSLKLAKTSATLYTKGLTKYTIKPVLTGISGKVKYSSSNKKVAAVSSKGVVTAKKKGTAKITVKCGSYKATLKVTVKNPTLKLKKTSATIKVKKKVTIKATAKPTGKITYKSSNKKVATVTSKGVVKGVRKGTATITVKCNGVTKKFKVKVK